MCRDQRGEGPSKGLAETERPCWELEVLTPRSGAAVPQSRPYTTSPGLEQARELGWPTLVCAASQSPSLCSKDVIPVMEWPEDIVGGNPTATD